MKYCVGVDVGGTSVKLGIFEDTGRLIMKWSIPTRKDDGSAHLFENIAESINKKLADAKISKDEVTGVGMGVPGPVLPDGYVEVCVNLGLKDRFPARELSALMDGMPVKLSNDANIAALGEMWQGGGKGYDSICMVTLGTGVGGGIIHEGKIVNGTHGIAGEIGHMHVTDGEEEACNCGGHGCLEQYASATGIVRVAKRKLAEGNVKSGLRAFGGKFSAKDVCDLAKSGDEIALETLEYSMGKLGLVLSYVAMCSDPEVFVIGGGVSKAGEFISDIIMRHLNAYLNMIKKKEKNVVLAKLGNDAGIYGAAKMVLE